jgi:hypothetical protein
MMDRNVGTKDAAIRAVMAVILAGVGLFASLPGYLSFCAVLVSIILMATALTRECPVYRILHIATLREHHRRV